MSHKSGAQPRSKRDMSRDLRLEQLEVRNMSASDASTIVNFETVPGRTYELIAERFAIPSRSADTFGHALLRIKDVTTGKTIAELQGYAIDPFSPINYRDTINTAFGAIGGFGDKLELIQTNFGATNKSVSLGLVSADKVEGLEVALKRFQQFTQTGHLSYSAIPGRFTVASKLNPKVDIQLSTYNSNSIGREVFDIAESVAGLSPSTKAKLRQLFGAGLGSPGIDDDISKDFGVDFTKPNQSAFAKLDIARFEKMEKQAGASAGAVRQKLPDGTYLLTWQRADGATIQDRAKYGFQLEFLQTLESTVVAGADLIVNRATDFANSINKAASEITVSVWDGLKTIKGEDIARVFGSHVSEALVSGGSLAKTVAGAFGSKIASALFTVGQDLSKALDAKSVDAAILQVVDQYAGSSSVGKLTGQLQKEVKDGVSSIIVGQLAESLGVSGAQGVAFTAFGDGVLKGFANQVIDVIRGNASLNVEQLLVGVNLGDVSSALGRYFGVKFSSIVGDSKTAGEALVSSIGGSLASVSYATSVAGWLEGTVLAKGALTAVTNVLGATIGNAVMNVFLPFLGTIITTFAGNTIGKYVGSAIDLLTGGWLSRRFGSPGWHHRYLSVDPQTNQLRAPVELDFSKKTTADLRRGTNMLADTTVSTVNPVFDELGVVVDVNATPLPIFSWLNSSKPQGANDYQIRRAGDRGVVNAAGDFARLVRIGTEDILMDLKYSGGDPLKVRAFEAWKASVGTTPGDSLVALMNNLAVARDYAQYLSNPQLINAMILAEPDSVYSIGWVDTIIRAQALGLDKVVAPKVTVTAPDKTTAGMPLNIELKVATPDGRPMANFSGWIRVVVDGNETLAFAGQSNADGRITISQQLVTAGSHVVEVKLGSNLLGRLAVDVAPSSAVRLQLVTTEHTTAGKAISVTVTAYDKFGNIATGYNGLVQLTTNDTTASIASSLVFTANDKGSRTITAAFETQGDQVVRIPFKKRVIVNPKNLTLTATDASAGLSSTVVIQAGS